MISGLFKMLPTNCLFTNNVYLTDTHIYAYKRTQTYVYEYDLALNNQQKLICQPTKLTRMTLVTLLPWWLIVLIVLSSSFSFSC